MLKDERQDKILELLDEEIYTSAESLAKRLFVSMPTIRRDLSELSDKGKLIRSHGGAKRLNAEHAVMPIDLRETYCRAEKRKICSKAAKMIKDGDVIFIDASTTAYFLSEFIDDKKNITVVTNSIPLTVALRDKKVRCYTTGGELQPNSNGFAGVGAEEYIKRFNFDLTFFSSYGVADSGRIVDASLPETELRLAALRLSEKSVFLCDRTKFGKIAAYNLMHLDDVDVVITDEF